jgi:putative effector of murein hydrolase
MAIWLYSMINSLLSLGVMIGFMVYVMVVSVVESQYQQYHRRR